MRSPADGLAPPGLPSRSQATRALLRSEVRRRRSIQRGELLPARSTRPTTEGAMAIDFDLNLFTSDPRLLVRGDDLEYERAAEALQQLADPRRLKLLHALALG